MEISGFPQTIVWALDFLSEVHPSRAALQPCLDGPAWTSGSLRYEDRTLTQLRHVLLLVERCLHPSDWRISTRGRHSLDLQALAARIGEANDGVVAERGQSFPAIRFDVSKAPAFAAIGLD